MRQQAGWPAGRSAKHDERFGDLSRPLRDPNETDGIDLPAAWHEHRAPSGAATDQPHQ